MLFILPAATGAQAVAANPPAVEARVARAAVATGAPFGGWRLLAQSGTSAGASSSGMGSGTSYGGPSTGSTNGMQGSNGTNGPSGSNGTNGTNMGAPDYGPTGAAGGMKVPGATPTATPGTSLPGTPSSTPSTGAPSTTLPGPNVGAPNPPSSTSVPSYGGGTTQ